MRSGLVDACERKFGDVDIIEQEQDRRGIEWS